MREEIVLALRTRLMSVPGLFPVAWQGGPAFTPTTGVPYIEESFVFGTADDAACGPDRTREVNESYQLMICWPPEKDIRTALSQAVAIEGAMLGTPLFTSSGVSVWMRSTTFGSPRLEEGWQKMPVVVNYRFIYQS